MSSLKKVDSLELMSSKENIQPVYSGHDAPILCPVSQVKTNSEKYKELNRERNEFEVKLKCNSSQDPLSDWCEYIKWIELNFSNQPKEGKLDVVLQKCINQFKDNKSYVNDERFVKICIKYAELEENSVELLSQMHRHGIGISSAQLYIIWAEKYAMENCFKKANAIYERGVKNSAQPNELLQESFKNFRTFLVRKMLNDKEIFQPTSFKLTCKDVSQPFNVSQPESSQQNEIGLSFNIESNAVSTGNTICKKKTTSKSNKIINAFENSENFIPETNSKKKLENNNYTHKLTKENLEVQTFKDNNQKLLNSEVHPFEVHKDENLTVNKVSQTETSSVLKLPQYKADYEDENFLNAPLFYFEPYDPSKKSAYCKEMVYAGGSEFQFEELRAMQYQREREKKLNLLTEKVVAKSSVFSKISESIFSSKLETNSSSYNENKPLKSTDCSEKEKVMNKSSRRKTMLFTLKEPAPAVKTPVEVEQCPGNDLSLNQTIHTKEALSEMQQLWFSKPASPISDVSNEVKETAKPILKSTKPKFNLYVDESCIQDSDVNATMPQSFDLKENKQRSVDIPETNAKNEPKKNSTKFKPLVENCKENLYGTEEEMLKCTQAISLNEENSEAKENVKFTSGKKVENDRVETKKEIVGADATFIQCNSSAITETWNFTKGFQFPRGESTPNVKKSPSQKEVCNESVFKSDKIHSTSNDKNLIEQKQFVFETNDKRMVLLEQENENYPKNLSVIAETSREYRSSSSRSSGASTLVSRLSKNFPYTPSDAKNSKNSLIYSRTTSQKPEMQNSVGYESSNEFMFKTPMSSKKNTCLNTTLELMTKLNTIESTTVSNNIQEECNSTETKIKIEDDVDPFCDKLIANLLEKVGFPKKYHEFGYNFVNDNDLPVPKVGSTVTLGTHEYTLKKILGEGSYAKIYVLVDTQNGEQMIGKFQKPPCFWEFYISREIKHRIQDKNLVTFFMDIESAYFFKKSSVLLTRPIEYGDLLSVISKMKQNNLLKQSLAMYFTCQVLQIFEILHSCKIIHGDVKPDNFLLRFCNNKLQLQLIDFGRGIDMTLFPEGTKFTKIVTTKDFTTIEMKLGKPWTYQIDYYGLASTGHCLLFGEYMKVTQKAGLWNITKAIPRYFAKKEWEIFFKNLLNVKSCSDLPNLPEIRTSFEAILEKNSEIKSNLQKLNNLLNGC